MGFNEALLKYGKIALETRQRLEVDVRKREGFREWRIYLLKMMEHGKEELFEDDE